MIIADIVNADGDGQGTFRNDVQLRWYVEATSENRELAERYMFTRTSAGEHKSPIGILYQVRQAFLLDSQENRFVVVATYGHGKSHLALAMANFFGKPADSTEVSCLTHSIRRAFGNDAEAESFIEFKHGRKRHLVVCLEGTRPGDLAQLFFSALQTALRNQPETAKLRPPFWLQTAREIVSRISGDAGMTARADEYLREHWQPGNQSPDLALLRQRLEDEDTSVYDLVRHLYNHLHGVHPEMGNQVSLATVVEWAADTLCGPEPEKPFSGLLILFDEFSAFIRNYALRTTPGTPLQDLLDGVANRRGKVVFVAFGQTDPDTSVRNVLQTADEHHRGALLLELQRLPGSARFHLYTTMESVLDSYLRQDRGKLTQALEQGSAWPAVEKATDDCLTLFRRRYEDQLQWDAEKFQEVVTYGAFPLHPATTALLCNVELLESNNPRSVLGFIFNQLDLLAQKPPVVDRRPTWAHAVHLVDWFKEQLADDEWRQYQEAVRQRGGDMTPAEAAVLKAMLLHVVARMTTQAGVEFTTAICHLTGLEMSAATGALSGLAEATVIEYQPNSRKYSFWPLGGGIRPIIDLVTKKMGGRPITWEQWRDARDRYLSAAVPPVPISVKWGSAKDWAAPQYLLTREFASKEKVAELVSADRGAIVWLVARNDADVEWFGQNAGDLAGAFTGRDALPVTFICPSRPTPDLPDILFRTVVLGSLRQTELSQYGEEAVQTVKSRFASTLGDQVSQLMRSMGPYHVPVAYDAALRAAPPANRTDAIAQRLYELAYSSSPPAFFDQYDTRANNLRSAIKIICPHLLQNTVHLNQYVANRVAVGLVDNFLVQGRAGSWGLLTVEKRLQEPQSTRTRAAWEALDQAVPATGAEVRIDKVVRQLQGPPFGYNESTLPLLFCAWFGYYRHHLRVFLNGAIQTTDVFAQAANQAPSRLVELLGDPELRIRRKDAGAAATEVRDLVAQSRTLTATPVTKGTAVVAISKLAEFLQDEQNGDGDRAQAEEAKATFQAALDRATKYDADVRKLRADAGQTTDVPALVRLVRDVADLQAPGGVTAEEPSVAAIREELERLLATRVDAFCKKYEELPSLTEFTHRHEQLTRTKSAVRDSVELQDRVHRAIRRLEQRKLELEAKQQDAAIMAQLRAFSPTVPLKQLREALETASGLECFSSEAKELKAKTREDIQRAIDKLHEFVAGLDGAVSALARRVEAVNLRNSIRERKLQFADTPEAERIESALTRCESLEHFFAEVAAVPAGTLANREEYASCLAKLNVLREVNGSNATLAQTAALEEVQQAVASRVATLEQNALKWLEQMQSRVASPADPQRLLNELGRVPPFLPDDRNALVTEMVAKVQQVIAERADSERAARQAAQQEAALIAQINSVSTTGPLKALRQAQECLAAVQCGTSEKAQALKARRQTELSQATASLEAFAAGLRDKLAVITTSKEAAKLRSSIVERRLFYAETPESQLVEDALARCERLERALGGLAVLASPSFRTSADRMECENRLASLRASADGCLSPAQTALFALAEQKVRERVELLTREACEWLKQMQAKAQNPREADHVLDELRHVREFLPDDKRPEVAAIATQVQRVLDQDVCGNIRRLFDKIADTETRLRLLNELQASVREGQSV